MPDGLWEVVVDGLWEVVEGPNDRRRVILRRSFGTGFRLGD